MRTVLRVVDNSGAKTIRCINIYRRRRQRPSGNVGSEIVASVTSVDHSIRNKKARKGDIIRALIVRSKNEPVRKDGGFVRTGETAAILLTPDGSSPLGTRVRGPISASLDRSRHLKVLSLAPVTLFSTLAAPQFQRTGHCGLSSSITPGALPMRGVWLQCNSKTT